jgi:hypothetical protein
MKNYQTGWFCIPGGRTGGQVHVVSYGKPICGQRLHKKAEFQWCAHGIKLDYIECARCKGRAKKMLDADFAEYVQRALPKGYRILNDGEIIKFSDLFFRYDEWNAVRDWDVYVKSRDYPVARKIKV